MARANRHYIPGYVWHITHRCHKKEFLLKFVRDRRRWLEYNIRKQRKGAFWEDRYHATAIEKTTITINNDRYHLRDNISDYGNTPTHGNGPDARLHVETTRLLVGPN